MSSSGPGADKKPNLREAIPRHGEPPSSNALRERPHAQLGAQHHQVLALASHDAAERLEQVRVAQVRQRVRVGPTASSSRASA